MLKSQTTVNYIFYKSSSIDIAESLKSEKIISQIIICSSTVINLLLELARENHRKVFCELFKPTGRNVLGNDLNKHVIDGFNKLPQTRFTLILMFSMFRSQIDVYTSA